MAALLALLAAGALTLPAAAAEDTANVKLVATNDVHGMLEPPDADEPIGGLLQPSDTEEPLGGLAYLATHLREIEAAHPETLHVDAGDLAGATPWLSRRFADEPTIEAMNLLGLDVQAIGNHEFDRGWEEVLRRRDGGCVDDDCGYRGGATYEGAEFVKLSTNVTFTETGEPLTAARHLAEVDGVTVGFVGVTTTDIRAISSRHRQGLDFEPWDRALEPAIAEVRDAGADVVVVLRHVGGRQRGGPNECVKPRGGAGHLIADLEHPPDVVVDGHSHRAYVCDREGWPLFTQADEYTQWFTEIDLEVDRATGEVVSREARNRPVTHDVAPAADVEELIARYRELPGLPYEHPTLEDRAEDAYWRTRDLEIWVEQFADAVRRGASPP